MCRVVEVQKRYACAKPHLVGDTERPGDKDFGRGHVFPGEAKRLEKGVQLDDGLARAEEVRIERLSGATCRFFLTLREGRKREVRRMMDVLDLVVRRLVRVEFGPVALANLSPGEYRELGVDEVKALRAAVELEDYDGDT